MSFNIFKQLYDELNEQSAIKVSDHKIKHLSAGQIDYLIIYDIMITDEGLRKVTRDLFKDGHFSECVLHAYKYIYNTVKNKVKKIMEAKNTNGKPMDGSALMAKALCSTNPIIKLNANVTESEKNEQEGYKLILMGCMKGIRNPLAHDDPNENYLEKDALTLLIGAQHLLDKINNGYVEKEC